MKLFYKQGACSLASHLVLQEIGATFELEGVDTEAGVTKSGLDYNKVNPKGYVPVLQLASCEVLTEGACILQYIADQYSDKGLAPVAGTVERARLYEYLNYVSAELHKAFAPFFSSAASAESKKRASLNVAKKFDYIDQIPGDGRTFLLGENFSVADTYLFVVSNWSNFVGVDLTQWSSIAAFVERIAKRPATQAAMQAEGLI